MNTDPKLRLVTLLIMFCIWEFTFVKARVRVTVSNIGGNSEGRLDLENIQPSYHFAFRLHEMIGPAYHI